MRLTKTISLNFNKDLSTGMVLLDIEKAFDSVWHDAILHKLNKYKYPIFIIKIIQSFLNERKSFVRVNKANSELYDLIAGVPQGSLLSPHLFNIFINDIPKPKSCKLALYADDSALIASSFNPRSLPHLCQKLSNGLIELKNFFDRWKIKLNSSKTEAILFTHSIIMERSKETSQINFNNQLLPWNQQVRYLGVILDKKLLFKQNIDYNITKSKKAMALIYPLLRKNSFLNVKTKKILYTAYVRSILTYACPVFSNCAKTHIQRLQVLQNKNLRMVLSAPYSTRIAELHEQLEIPSIHDFIAKLTDRFYNQSVNSVNIFISNLNDYSGNVINFRIKHRLPKKII